MAYVARYKRGTQNLRPNGNLKITVRTYQP